MKPRYVYDWHSRKWLLDLRNFPYLGYRLAGYEQNKAS